MNQRQKRKLCKRSKQQEVGSNNIPLNGGSLLLICVSSLLWHVLVSIISFDSFGATAFVITTTTTTPFQPLGLLWRSYNTRRRSVATAVDGAINNDNEDRSQLNKHDKKWLQTYDTLKEYHQAHGHCDVPREQFGNKQSKDERRLGDWVRTQRYRFKKNKLSQDRKELLDEIGFNWILKPPRKKGTIVRNTWLEQYEKLKKYRNKYGDCYVPRGWTDKLGHWVKTQRYYFAKNAMKQDRKEMLDEIGFEWKSWDMQWQQNYDDLKAYHDEHGDFIVPNSKIVLYHWVRNQRKLFKVNAIQQERKELLDEIGFEWTTQFDKQWRQSYDDLKAYRDIHGHCRVRQSSRGLGRWVDTQRKLFLQNKMRQDRKELLDDIGFVWTDYNEAKWMEQYKNLVSFHKEHGHFRIPATKSTSEILQKLRRWVVTQRMWYRTNRLQQSRKDLLDEINFPWETKTRSPPS